jgi:methylmalonyl-CoA mutase
MKSTSPFSIRDEFQPVDYDTWRAVVEADLKGVPFEKKFTIHTYEGIDFEPLYGRKHFSNEQDPQGFPGLAPFVRGARVRGGVLAGVDLRQAFAIHDVQTTSREIREDVAGGVTSIELNLESLESVDELEVVLTDVDLSEVGVALEAGAEYESAAKWLADVWKRRGVHLRDVRGAFNADPLAMLARSGGLPMSADEGTGAVARLAKWASKNCPHVTTVGVDTSPYHNAGATATQDLAFAMATAVAYLRAMTEGGLSVDAAARQMLFRVGLGTHHFLAIGKMRALRRLWGRVLEACSASAATSVMRIQARSSDRVLTRRDPYVNVLRNAAGVFSAIVGGADIVTSVPLDHLIGLPDESARRIARNTVLVLQEEAHLHRVIDPAGGSWFLETITDQLADEAWRIFQEIERRGGILPALESGWVAEQIAAAQAARSKDIARRKEGITGVSEFPNLAEEMLVRPKPVASKQRGTTAKPKVSIPAIEPRRFAAPFEELRDATDQWQARTGQRPRAFLVNLGPLAHFTARAMYAKNFFEAGGIEAISRDGFSDVAAAVAAFQASGAKIAVLCSSDKLYPEFVPKAAAALKAAGAQSVVLAGNPGDKEPAWRAAGVDRFIFVKCDVLETLRSILREEGVIPS